MMDKRDKQIIFFLFWLAYITSFSLYFINQYKIDALEDMICFAHPQIEQCLED